MPFSEIYRKQVALLIQTLPLIAEEECFALKGGTAINLFVRDDMPRLSVDIDLTYLPVHSRPDSLAAIDAAMKRIAERGNKSIFDVRINTVKLQPEETVIKLLIRAKDVQIKVEVTRRVQGVSAMFGEATLMSWSRQDSDACDFRRIRPDFALL